MSAPPRSERVSLINTGGVRQVAEASFDMLHMEMVYYFARQISAQNGDTRNQSPAELANNTKIVTDKLETMGFSVGHRLCERYTKDIVWLAEQMDCMKFLCKEFWLAVFKKQIDKLQTDNKGKYVLHDSQFRMLSHFSIVDSMPQEEFLAQARVYVAFSVGLIRGALSNLGVIATVKADITKMPAIQFTITDVERVRRTDRPIDSTTNQSSTSAASPNQSAPSPMSSASRVPTNTTTAVQS